MAKRICVECDQAIASGKAHLRSVDFELVAWCDECWEARQVSNEMVLA